MLSCRPLFRGRVPTVPVTFVIAINCLFFAKCPEKGPHRPFHTNAGTLISDAPDTPIACRKRMLPLQSQSLPKKGNVKRFSPGLIDSARLKLVNGFDSSAGRNRLSLTASRGDLPPRAGRGVSGQVS